MIDKELFEKLNTDVTASMCKRLVTYAHVIIRYGYLGFRNDGIIPDGLTAEDVVHNIIEKVYYGKRNWDYKNFPDTEVIFKGMIKSEIYSLFEKKSSKIKENILIDKFDDEENVIEIKDEMLCHDRILEIKDKIEFIYKLTDDDEELQEILICLEDQITKRSDIAETLNITPDECTNRIKRLHRKINCLR